MPSTFRALADAIAGAEAPPARRRFAEACAARGLVASDDATDLAAVLECAYPATARTIGARPEAVLAIARGIRQARDARAYRRAALASLGDATPGVAAGSGGNDRVPPGLPGGSGGNDRVPPGLDETQVRRGLRLFAERERLRVAARELAPHGSDVDVTSRELSDLADVCIEIALAEALSWAEARFGVPRDAAGARCGFVVIGMGKLGGCELNAGSDVDLLLFYATDEGEVVGPDGPADVTLHEYFARVSQRMTATLADVTEDGFVWRVDLRLRPEGARGPLVNSLAAAERYYETWGRTWERAALLRARPVAGDLALGREVLASLAPFVWRREVNPALADEMIALTARARAELASDPERDVKLGVGGIRECEFFVQSLQLIWGGRDPSLRSANTLDALKKLRARGLVTDREGRDMADAYLALRRVEHRVQFATGIQTHALPPSGDPLLDRIGRSLGFASGHEMERDLDKTRRRVAARFASLSREKPGGAGGGDLAPPGLGTSGAPQALDRLFYALDASDEAAVLAWLSPTFGVHAAPDLARHLTALARRPDYPLGASTRDRHPELAPVLVEALADAADPEQAARLLAAFFARLGQPSVYARALADDPRAARRLVSLFGASAFLGASMVGHPELADRLLFGRGAPTPDSAARAVDDEIAALPEGADADSEEFVGALRRAKWRVTIEVGLADLAGELTTRACTAVLSSLADATLARATRYALRERGIPEDAGLAVIAMGKLGGGEIGYGSDLDLLFVYDAPADADDAQERYARAAQRAMRLVSAPHGDGPGYELDTRLRPSGSQGLLVVSLDAFARYHGHGAAGAEAHDWERQALLKARAIAGDAALGAKVIAIAHEAAYDRGAPPPEHVHHLRMRMEREIARERPGRHDLKVGYGGLVDVEFAAQWLQMKHGRDPRVRTTDTETALGALEACGYLEPALAAPLREAYRTLRRMEQRLRVLHGTSASLIEEGAPGLAQLARRMGTRDGPRASAEAALLARYREITRDARAAYLAVLGLSG
jgi:glutamate-ammonia-ligase adenylyltransferase